jgi:signal transduction histidine kinase
MPKKAEHDHRWDGTPRATAGSTRCAVRLADFMLENLDAIVDEWETFARSLCAGDGETPMSASALRDHAHEILSAVVCDMNSFQTDTEQAEKSKGRGLERGLGGAGHIHAVLRLESGFRLNQLVAEYRALRASVLRLWKEADGDTDLDGVMRFNEAIDEALTAATNRYMERMERYRDQFLGILGHDLRNPVGAIMMGASALERSPDADARSVRIAGRILRSSRRMDRLICDLLDLTRTRLGGGIPLHRAPMDLAPVCQQVVAELKEVHPDEPLAFALQGDLHGEWDGDRLAQVVSNLVGNAMQHGTKEAPVTVVARDDGDEVVLEVHNEGTPIPENAVSSIFEPMVRAGADTEQATGNLGLGLYIAEQVVTAHGGKIGVQSTAAGGTTFIVHLPRTAS